MYQKVHFKSLGRIKNVGGIPKNIADLKARYIPSGSRVGKNISFIMSSKFAIAVRIKTALPYIPPKLRKKLAAIMEDYWSKWKYMMKMLMVETALEYTSSFMST